MECYLDNAATTRVSQSVYDKMTEVLLKDFGNPSSKHKLGMDSEEYIKEARSRISNILKCDPTEITFTSGGTESNNMALIGAALANKRKGTHIIASNIEHASVYNPVLFLKEQGFDTEFAKVGKDGKINPESIAEQVREDTILVSVMFVNNEVGSINDIAAISKAIKAKNPDVIFHVDAIQAFGKLKIIPKNLGIDMLSVSGHKIHGPKGSGFIYIKKGTKLKPIIYGGGQEKDMRSGTENVPAIAGIGQAAFDIYSNFDEISAHLHELKKQFVEGLAEISGTHVHLSEVDNFLDVTAPHIVSVGFDGIDKSEVLLNALSNVSVYVSSGSACSANHPDVSGTLKGIGVDQKYLQGTLRFSFCKDTTKEEIDYCLSMIKDIYPKLTRFKRY